MDKHLEAFFGSAKSVRLRTGEREAIREFLKDFLEDHPVRVGQSVRHTDPMTILSAARGLSLSSREKDDAFTRIVRHMRRHPLRTEHVSFFDRISGFFAFHRMLAGALCIALVFGTGGSLAYAAEGALPDDLLYDVKVNFTEPLREFAARTPEHRAVWKLKKIERRLAETNAAMALGRMNSHVAERMRTNLTNSLTSFEEHIASSREKGVDVPDAMILKYEALLARNEHALTTGTGSIRSKEAVRIVLQKVQEARVRSFGERARGDQEDKREALQYFNEHVLALPQERLKRMEERLDEVLDEEELPPAVRKRLEGVRDHMEETGEVLERKHDNRALFYKTVPLREEGEEDSSVNTSKNKKDGKNEVRHGEDLIPQKVVTGNVPLR